VPLSALTAEIKRRRDEWDAAQKDLAGFGPTDSIPARPARTPKTAKGSTAGSKVIQAAQRLRHAKRRHAPKVEISQLERDLEQARAALAQAKKAGK
jgi:hypothetical protein